MTFSNSTSSLLISLISIVSIVSFHRYHGNINYNYICHGPLTSMVTQHRWTRRTAVCLFSYNVRIWLQYSRSQQVCNCYLWQLGNIYTNVIFHSNCCSKGRLISHDFQNPGILALIPFLFQSFSYFLLTSVCTACLPTNGTLSTSCLGHYWHINNINIFGYGMVFIVRQNHIAQ